MGLTIPCMIKCDGYLPGRIDCKETIQYAVDVNARETKRHEFKVRLDDRLPEGWLAKMDSGYDGDKIEFFCPTHGKELEPWRY